jgi:lysophospholipase L1-like esterase
MMLGMLSAVLAGLVLMVLAVEAGCRAWIRWRSRYYVWPPRMREEMRLASEVFPELDPSVRFDINRDGERGNDVPRDREGLFRVLATGGSAVECFALDQPKSWPAVLERLLAAPQSLDALGARQVHVGNIGHSGVGSADLDHILERVLPQYRRLDAILIMVGASDVYRWLEEGAPASRPSPPIPDDMLFAVHPRQRFGWKPTALAVLEVARRLRRAWLRRLVVKDRAGAWYAAARRMRAQATEIRETMPDATVMLANFEDHFRRLCGRAMAHAGRVIVLLQPWFEGDYTPEEAARFWHGCAGRPWKEEVKTYYSLEVVNRLLDQVHARAAQVADELGIQRVNLRSVLTERVRHYFDHDHYTPAGAAVVAQTVAAALVSRPATNGGAGVGAGAGAGANGTGQSRAKVSMTASATRSTSAAESSW